MNIGSNTELLDRLAASYAVGTLRGGARRRLEAHARQSAAVRTALLLWQERMHAMNELPAPIQPSPNVWKRIEIALNQELLLARQKLGLDSGEGLAQQVAARLSRILVLWRGAALAGGLATVVAVVVGMNHGKTLQDEVSLVSAQLQNAQTAVQQAQAAADLASQRVKYVAVLSDEKASESVLVTVDTGKNVMTVQRVGGYQESVDKTLQLWEIQPGSKPRSMGVLTQSPQTQLAVSAERAGKKPLLAVSLEPKGGVSDETGPTGPVLFKGVLLQTSM